MSDLKYWNGRAVDARNEYNESSSKANREELTFCRRVVVLIEHGIFGKETE